MSEPKDRVTELNKEPKAPDKADAPAVEAPATASEPASSDGALPETVAQEGDTAPGTVTAQETTPSQAGAPAVVPIPEEAREPVERPITPLGTTTRPERAHVHVAPNLLEVATGRAETTEEKKEAKEKHDLNETVHSMLIVGLAISTALMLIGIVEDVILQRAMPTVEPDLGQAVSSILSLRPSGFLGLGLLVLIATPILRVVGSIFAFAYERDWRFAGITFLVLMIVVTSILLGKG